MREEGGRADKHLPMNVNQTFPALHQVKNLEKCIGEINMLIFFSREGGCFCTKVKKFAQNIAKMLIFSVFLVNKI